MKRRAFIRYVGMGTLATAGTMVLSPQSYQAQTTTKVDIEWLGHTAFLFSGDNLRILVNPFETIGCTAGYPPPKVESDLVMVSSHLLDEGGGVDYVPNDPQVLKESGTYEFKGKGIEGIGMPHDRQGGRRFGTNVAWSWQQGGLDILHLGGAAAPIEMEQQILLRRPDLLILPVGGGPKAYNPEQAKAAMDKLRPKMVIPSHYQTSAADEEECDLVGVQEFLNLLDQQKVQRLNGNRITLSAQELPEEGTLVKVMQWVE